MKCDNEDRLLRLDEAAAILRLKPSTLRAWVLGRRIPYVKVGRLVRIRRDDVDSLIAASVVPARPEVPKKTKQMLRRRDLGV